MALLLHTATSVESYVVEQYTPKTQKKYLNE